MSKEQGGGTYGFAMGCGGLWVKSVLVEKTLSKGERILVRRVEMGNKWEERG